MATAKCASGRKHFIVLQDLTGATEDAHGHVDRTDDSNWTAYETAYATVVSKGGREFWKIEQMRSDVTHVWTVPYSVKMAAATSDMRLKHDGNVYNIVWVDDMDLAHKEVQVQTRIQRDT